MAKLCPTQKDLLHFENIYLNLSKKCFGDSLRCFAITMMGSFMMLLVDTKPTCFRNIARQQAFHTTKFK